VFFVNKIGKKDYAMIGERYSIEVSEGLVVIHGKLSIEEAFDFLNFFEKKGFDEVGIGQENSALCLYNNKAIYGDKDEEPVIPEKDIWESFYEEKSKENEKLRERIKQLERLIKQLLDPKSFIEVAKNFIAEEETDGVETSTTPAAN
jgi:type I site-specific restriction-modification system R (restriction) subunit